MPDSSDPYYLDPSEYSYGNLDANKYPWLNDPGFNANGLPNPSYMPSGGGGMGDGGGSSPGGGGIPLLGPIVSGAGSFLSNLFGMKNQNSQLQKQRDAQAALQANSLAQGNAQSTQALAAAESNRDPFRSRMTQVGDVARLDRVQNASTAPRQLNLQGPYAAAVPQMTGGYSYQRSPDVRNAAGAAKTSIMSGTPDPTMTNPANYGKTGALDLIGIAAGQKNPALASSMATGAPAAASSLGADPVANMIRQGYQSVLGRSPSDAEIQTTIGNLSKIYGRQMTSADSGLIQNWIQQNLAKSPEAMGRGGMTPSYMQPSAGGAAGVTPTGDAGGLP